MRILIDFKLLGKLLAALLVVGGLIHGLHHLQVTRNAGQLLARVDHAEAQGLNDRASRLLGTYVSLVPEDTDARARYAKMLEEHALSPRARFRVMTVYEQVLVREPDRHDIRRRVAKLALDIREYETAQSHLEILLQAMPNDSELEYLKGRCLESKEVLIDPPGPAHGQHPGATEWYIASVKHNPGQLEAYARLATLYRDKLDRPPQAEAWLQQLVKENPKVVGAYLTRIRVRQSQNPSDAAARQARDALVDQDIAQALQVAPEEPEVLLLAADAAQKRRGDFQEARGYLERILKKYPNSPAAYEAMASLELAANRLDEAVKYLRRGLERSPTHNELLWNLANVLIQKGEHARAEEIITQIAEKEIGPGRMDFLKAASDIQDGNWLKGSQLLESARPLFRDSPELQIQTDYLLATCYEKLGDPDRRLLAYRRIIALDPLQVQARVGFAASQMSLGRLDDALEEYQRLIGFRQPPKISWVAVTELLIRRNLRLPAAQRQWDQINDILDRAVKAIPDATEVILIRAEVLSAMGKLDEARKVLEKARDKDPKVTLYWLALVELALYEANSEAALRLLSDAEKQLGDTAEVRLARARYVVNLEKGDSAKALDTLAEGIDQYSTDDQFKVLGGLAAAHFQLRQYAEASKLWRQQAILRPNDLQVQLLLFDVAVQLNQRDAMREALAAIQQIEGKGRALGLYCEARALIWDAEHEDKSGLNDARSLLVTVGTQRPAWSRVPLAMAQIEELRDQPDLAIREYLNAFDLGDHQLPMIRRLVQLLYERRRYEEADRIIRQLPAQTPVFGNLQQLAAEVSVQAQDFARALDLARKAVPKDSKDYRDHMWLGQILWVVGRLDEAKPAFRQAVALANTKPEPWVALVQFLARSDQIAEAETATAEAQAKLPAKEATLALAQCFAAIGKLDRAKELYEAAQKAQPDNVTVWQNSADFYLRTDQLKDAETCLRQITEMSIKEPGAAADARRLLMVVLAAGGSYQESREALAMMGLLNANKLDPGGRNGTIENDRARAVVLATQPERSQQQEAIRILEAINQRQPLTAEDQYLLAQLYERVGDEAHATEWMLRVLAANGDNPRYIIHQLHKLLRQRNVTEAELWLANLERVAPKTSSTVEMKARVLRAQNKGAEAVTLLKKEVPLKDPRTALSVGQLLEELGQGAAAEEFYRKYAAEIKQPLNQLALAGYLGRQKRWREALDVCEQAWQTCPAYKVAITCSRILHEPGTSEREYQRVQPWLEAAIQKQPRSADLLTCLADLHELRGHFAEAEETYQKAIKQDGRNLEALNNLAWLLAQRQGGSDEALQYVNQAIEVRGPIPEVLDTRAMVYFQAGKTEKALADWDSALGRVQVQPASLAAIYFHMARAHAKAGNPNEAKAAWQKAKAAGLQSDLLHPLERKSYQQLKDELDKG
jgi:tetratricopeptide (TPR) repeat protein